MAHLYSKTQFPTILTLLFLSALVALSLNFHKGPCTLSPQSLCTTVLWQNVSSQTLTKSALFWSLPKCPPVSQDFPRALFKRMSSFSHYLVLLIFFVVLFDFFAFVMYSTFIDLFIFSLLSCFPYLLHNIPLQNNCLRTVRITSFVHAFGGWRH